MKTRLILITSAIAFLWLPPAQAGSRIGGNGATAVTIPADTLSSGGGRSSADTGTANAVVITASIGGVIGTVTAATPAVSNRQGFIPQILPSFDHWAVANIPAGQDRTFTGDWNGDGILNGVAYVFGNTPVTTSGKGRITAPPLPIPPDVNVFLDRTSDLNTWALNRVRWVNGAPPTFVNTNWTIVAGEVVDTSTIAGGKAFYRYRVERR